MKLKRSSFVGEVESEEVIGSSRGVAFSLAAGRLFVGFGSQMTEYNEAGEAQGTFGTGVLSDAKGIAVNEASDEVYVVNGETRRSTPSVPFSRWGPRRPASRRVWARTARRSKAR